jgi:6-phosphogluconolactonase
MKLTRRHALSALATAVASATLGTAASSAFAQGDDDGTSFRSAKVFTSSNSPAGNQLLVYAHGASGLSLVASADTGGLGTGAGLGSQGAVNLSRDGRYVFVVNAASNTISTFRLAHSGPQLVSTVDSGGLNPISSTEHEGIVYVLNDGGAGNIAGFRNLQGQLHAIAGATRPLSVAGGAAPAQVGFSADGDALVVTEKGTNVLTSYRVGADGRAGAPIVTASPGQTPFGFAFNRRNHLVVAEAWGGAAGASTVSSYRFAEAAPATPLVTSAAVPDTQGAACWTAVTPNSRYAYIANTGSTSISSYSVGKGGQLALIRAVAGSTGVGSRPADNAVSGDGRHLYVRNGGTLTISSFEIQANGSLVDSGVTSGLPSSAVGLAAN